MGKFICLTCILAIVFTSCRRSEKSEVEKGVSIKLAHYRKSNISDPEYRLRFSVPEKRGEVIEGKEEILFNLKETEQDLQIDFRESSTNIKSVKCNRAHCNYIFKKEHIIIPSGNLKKGKNSIEIDFNAGKTSLNRNREFLYTLFVPDRARTAFPCFDQPNLKAVFKLKLEVPKDWKAVANGKLISKKEGDNSIVYEFAPTEKIPTYLFSFVAGKFMSVTREHNGRKHTFYHRETNKERLEKNTDEIFSLLFSSIDWLEKYTSIKYPFGKYDFIAIPSFQYNGMEHTGATLYNSTALFLDDNATQIQVLKRAGLIAHETAHMWFGDLVTMEWFDQVWLKEVFASYLANKMINPEFPDINHELMFALEHLPPAYNVDRTRGANSINQQLDNLKYAGTLYGSIIYHKSPVVMKMLEHIIGEEALQRGLRKYLSRYSYSNATWEELIEIMDAETPFNLKKWSKVWVDEPNRPHIYTTIDTGSVNKTGRLVVHQNDCFGKHRVWYQNITLIIGDSGGTEEIPLSVNKTRNEVRGATGKSMPEFIAFNGNGYGYYEFDEKSRSFLLDNISKLDNESFRGICWINLWENLAEGKMQGKDFVEAVLLNLPGENSSLIIELILHYFSRAYWLHLDNNERLAYGDKAEALLWEFIEGTSQQKLKASYFNCLVNIAETKGSIKRLYNIWEGKAGTLGLDITELQHISLAQNLAVKWEERADYLLNTQLKHISNPDMKERFRFIMPAISPDTLIRDNFFENLKDPKNRENERWVIRALQLLHHHTRKNHSLKYIRPALELLTEIQETGDIFFPVQWLDATYNGHNSLEVKRITENFLSENPDYPENLKLKILQSADLVLRQ